MVAVPAVSCSACRRRGGRAAARWSWPAPWFAAEAEVIRHHRPEQAAEAAGALRWSAGPTGGDGSALGGGGGTGLGVGSRELNGGGGGAVVLLLGSVARGCYWSA